MGNNTYGVRDVFENKSTGISNIGWDPESGGVTGKVNGTTYNFGKEGFTLDGDEHYQADLNTIQNNFARTTGYKGVSDALAAKGKSVYFDPGSNKLYVDGAGHNTDDMVNINGTLYASDDVIERLLGSTPSFNDPYAEAQKRMMSKIENNNSFSYDPSADKALANAQKQVMQAVREDYGSRGLLKSSDATLDGYAQAASMVPQYEQMAYERYVNDRNNMYDKLSALMGLSKLERHYYDNDLNNRHNLISDNNELRQNLIDNEFKRDENEYYKYDKDRNYDLDRDKVSLDRDKLSIDGDRLALDGKKFEHEKDYDSWEQKFKNTEYEDKKTKEITQTDWDKAITRFNALGIVSEEDAKVLGIPAGDYREFLKKR